MNTALAVLEDAVAEAVPARIRGAAVARHAFAAPRRIPVIVLTALREEESIAKLLRLGVRRVLNKPIEPEVLLQVVRDTLAESTKLEPLP